MTARNHLTPEERAAFAEAHAAWRRHIDMLVGELLLLDRFALDEVLGRVDKAVRERPAMEFRA